MPTLRKTDDQMEAKIQKNSQEFLIMADIFTGIEELMNIDNVIQNQAIQRNLIYIKKALT